MGGQRGKGRAEGREVSEEREVKRGKWREGQEKRERKRGKRAEGSELKRWKSREGETEITILVNLLREILRETETD